MELNRWQTKFSLWKQLFLNLRSAAAAAAKSLQSCPKTSDLLICNFEGWGKCSFVAQSIYNRNPHDYADNWGKMFLFSEQMTDTNSHIYWISIFYNNSILCNHLYHQTIAS